MAASLLSVLSVALAAGPVSEASIAAGLGRLSHPGWSVQIGLQHEAPRIELSAWVRYRAETFYDVFPQYRGVQVVGTAAARVTGWLSVGVATEALELYHPRSALDELNVEQRLPQPLVRLGMGPSVSATWRPSDGSRMRVRAAWLPLGTTFSLAHHVTEAEFAWRWFTLRVSASPGAGSPVGVVVVELGLRWVFASH